MWVVMGFSVPLLKFSLCGDQVAGMCLVVSFYYIAKTKPIRVASPPGFFFKYEYRLESSPVPTGE